MKKIIYLILAMLLSSATTYSQLKVKANGSVRMTGNASNAARVYVGDSLPDTYCYKSGLFSAMTSSVASDGIAIKGMAKPNSSTFYTAMGVWGDAGNASNGNFGVLGTLSGTGNGSAIYGTTLNYPDITISGRYAGYFFGETYICGNMTAFNYYTVSDKRLKENITPLKQEAQSSLSNVMDINVVKYNYPLAELKFK